MAHYNWSRYWIPRGTDVHLDFDGFVPDPGSPYRFHENNKIVSYEEIAGTHCLVLLGEPGIGKSTTIENMFKRSRSEVLDSSDYALHFDLGRTTSEEYLRNFVFDNSTIQTWDSNRVPKPKQIYQF